MYFYNITDCLVCPNTAAAVVPGLGVDSSIVNRVDVMIGNRYKANTGPALPYSSDVM